MRSLELPHLESRLRGHLLGTRAAQGPVIKDQAEGRFVDDGSLVSFVSGVSAQHQSDALNSILLAQLGANKKYDREANTGPWYQFYRNVLENVGWVVQEFQFQKYDASGSTVTIDQAVLDVLKAVATGSELAVVQATLAGLKSLADSDGRIVLWDAASHSSTAGCFQIAAATESGPVLALKMGAFHFTARSVKNRFLWFGYTGSELSLYKAAQVMTLDNDVYSRLRGIVIDKLGERARTFIADLPI